MPDEDDVPPEELVDPPLDDPPDEDVDPPDDEVEPPEEDVEPPDDEVELLPPLVLLDELVLGPGSVPVDGGGAGSVPFVVDARSDEGVPNRSLSFAPPHAARRATEEPIAALMKRLVFMRVAKH